MGSTISLTGSDTVKINDITLSDFADGDIQVLDFPNEIATVKVGKNGNALFAQNWSGYVADLTLRLVRGSADDKALLSLQASQGKDFSGFTLLSGEVIKALGDGQGNQNSDRYVCAGGIFSKNVPAKTNAEGDTEQSVAVYAIRFAKAARAID